MNGLEDEPDFADRLVRRLERHPGVRAEASALTGRVLLRRLSDAAPELDALVAEVRYLEPPPRREEDAEVPADVAGAAELAGNMARAAGAAIGLGTLAVGAVKGSRPTSRNAVSLAAAITLVQGLPSVSRAMGDAFGTNAAEIALGLPKIALLTAAGSPFGLLVAAAQSLHLVAALRELIFAQREYRERTSDALPPESPLRLADGRRAPFSAIVLEGTGSATAADGLPLPLAPDSFVPAGACLFGGPYLLEMQESQESAPEVPVSPTPKSLYETYLQRLGPISLAYAAATAVLTGSFSRTFTSLLLLSPRAGMIGAEAAAAATEARISRAGATILRRRPDRPLLRPDLLLLEAPRVMTGGWELVGAAPLQEGVSNEEVLARAAAVSAAAGSPWGSAFRGATSVRGEGGYDGETAQAKLATAAFSLSPPAAGELPASIRLAHGGDFLLVLRGGEQRLPLGVLILQPRLTDDVGGLVEACAERGIEVATLGGGDPLAVRKVAARAGVGVEAGDAVEVIQARQRRGGRVFFLADNAEPLTALAACNLAIVVAEDDAPPPASADLVVPGLDAVTALIEATALREFSDRNAVLASVAANLTGAAWALRGRPDLLVASRLVDTAALGAITSAWVRLRGGGAEAAAVRIPDPRPELWGEKTVDEVLQAFAASRSGLTSEEAEERWTEVLRIRRRHPFIRALISNARSPLTGFVAGAAGLALLHDARADAAVMVLTLAGNVLVGAWQEFRVGEVAGALEQMASASARVLRNGEAATIPAHRLVPGDILLVTPGDRLAADARVIAAAGLEVDEAGLTGESLPVRKLPSRGSAADRILLEGSDVVVGHGRAVVVAVGEDTRMGATAAALASQEQPESPLATRLSQLFRQVLPVTAAAGAVVTLGGLFRGRPLLPEVVTGASIALAALPEALPILAGMGQGAAARRLARRKALVRRPSAIEALGRVDVACVDKTGTLTEGRLALRVVATCGDEEMELPGSPSGGMLHVLRTAALASPHPDAGDAASHSTDVAVIRGAEQAGLASELRVERDEEARFDPVRPFHAAIVADKLRVKGAPEAIVHRCSTVAAGEEATALDDAGRRKLLRRANRLAERGLRVIMVAEGAAGNSTEDPRGLKALGFLGIRDPLRSTVPDALRRCREAGVRVVVLTGDHPATARAIGNEAGLLDAEEEILTGEALSRLGDEELDAMMERIAVIARATPLDKLRIIESLRRRGHTIAMTGDGVNDAPALRLADVGVAMGIGGTEVARQAADVVLADDDFASLVEALVEGRSFWRNLRRALALLLGGNLGELGFMMVGSVFGLGATLTVRQILATNLITDALPAFAVAVQQPEDRHLAGLDREGTTALGEPLRDGILRRAVATAAPALAAYLVASRIGTVVQARSVGFATIVATQLALTVDAGRAQGNLTPPVIGAVAASGGAVLALLTVPPLRAFFDLATPPPLGWGLVGGSALIAPLLSRNLPGTKLNGSFSPSSAAGSFLHPQAMPVLVRST